MNGSEGAVRLLVDAGAAVNAPGLECGTALQAAAAGGHGAVVELLLEAGADANSQCFFYFSTWRNNVRLESYRFRQC